jgi:pimeloyl-ACP methyl ester carboxylesterase
VPLPVDDAVTHRWTDTPVRLHYVCAGPDDGPLVLFLHGFPEFWYSWRHQLPALAAAGYRAVAPDLRGYALSDKPDGLEAYTGEALVDDVAGLLAAEGAARATVIGHDWGGVVAWLTALRRPDLVDRLVILNAPHPASFLTALRSPVQMLRSSYMAFFQLPVVPEALLAAQRGALVRWTLRAASAPGAFTDADLERYADAFAERGALTGPLNYYRAMGRRLPQRARSGRQSRVVAAPTLVLWGAEDPVLPTSLADPGRSLVPDCRVELVEGAGHFVHADAPARVNTLLLEFLRASLP